MEVKAAKLDGSYLNVERQESPDFIATAIHEFPPSASLPSPSIKSSTQKKTAKHRQPTIILLLAYAVLFAFSGTCLIAVARENAPPAPLPTQTAAKRLRCLNGPGR